MDQYCTLKRPEIYQLMHLFILRHLTMNLSRVLTRFRHVTCPLLGLCLGNPFRTPFCIQTVPNLHKNHCKIVNTQAIAVNFVFVEEEVPVITPRKNVCACVNLTCKSIANLMKSCSERFRRLKMAVKRRDFILCLYS